MTFQAPLWLQNGSYPANDMRSMVNAVFTGAGVVTEDALRLTPGTGLRVTAAAGQVVVQGTDSGNQLSYLCWLDADFTCDLASSPASGQSRVDLIVGTVRDATENAGPNNDWLIQAIEGTATAGTPVAPAAPASSFIIGTVAVAGLATSISTANITDLRVKALGAGEHVGKVELFAGFILPMSWAICDGSAVSRTLYPMLFAALSTWWGAGDGVSTFNLPDFRSRAPVGAAAGSLSAGRTAVGLGTYVGEESHVLTVAELASHNHFLTDPGHAHLLPGNVIAANGSPPVGLTPTGATVAANQLSGETTGGSGTGIGLAASGSSAPHNNVQPSAAANFIIRLA